MTDDPKDWNAAYVDGHPVREAADEMWAAESSGTSPPRLVWSRPSFTERPAQPEDEIERLALLDLFEYERVRDEEAKRLKVRVSILDEQVSRRRKADEKGTKRPSFLAPPVPWPESSRMRRTAKRA